MKNETRLSKIAVAVNMAVISLIRKVQRDNITIDVQSLNTQIDAMPNFWNKETVAISFRDTEGKQYSTPRIPIEYLCREHECG